MKKHFVLKLNPPRTTFAQDMTDDERSIMQQHSTYWRNFMTKGFVITFGPVLDPKGVYGLGIVEVDGQEQLEEFMANDPARKLCKYEFYPMMAVVPER
jgi:uncharacterized protein YciI